MEIAKYREIWDARKMEPIEWMRKNTGLLARLLGKGQRQDDFTRRLAYLEKDEKGQTLPESIIMVVFDNRGNAVGLWFSNTNVASNVGLLKVRVSMALGDCISKEQRKALMLGDPRVVPNSYDDSGGCFLMLGGHEAPGEKAYVCDVCGRRFSLAQLDEHYAKTAEQAIQVLRARAREGTGISNISWSGALNTLDETGKAWCPRCVPTAKGMPGPGRTVRRAV